MQVEKNDVSINKLFSWGKVFILENGEDEILVYMRVLGDADLNKARVYAIRESAKLRRALRDPNSDEHLISVKDIEELTKDNLVNYNIIFSARDITQSIWKAVKVPYPKQPKSDASLEEMEKYQLEVDEFPNKREQAVREAMKKEEDKRRKELEKMSKDELYELYKKQLVNELCEQKAITSFKEISTYLGCYKDDDYKERFFNDLDEFLNLETDQKVEFMSAYDTLEMGTEEIKKLREATQ